MILALTIYYFSILHVFCSFLLYIYLQSPLLLSLFLFIYISCTPHLHHQVHPHVRSIADHQTSFRLSNLFFISSILVFIKFLSTLLVFIITSLHQLLVYIIASLAFTICYDHHLSSTTTIKTVVISYLCTVMCYIIITYARQINIIIFCTVMCYYYIIINL